MCNLAGYAGSENAAPILLDMLMREEGFDAGFYTGIATIHEGKIHYAKVLGDTRSLIDNTDAMNLPGKIGIAHSRPGLVDEGREWAHPFIGYKNDEPRLAYIANGGVGYFSFLREKHNAITDELLREGYVLTSRVNSESAAYCKLQDGSTVHMSDVMCNLILRNMDRGNDAQTAMENAFCEMPSEIVGLMLSLTEPDKIFFSRINQPMFLSFSSNGAYLATTAMAFPDNVKGEPQLLPAQASGYIHKNAFCSKPFSTPPTKVARIDAKTYHDAYNLICEALAEEKRSFYNPVSGYVLPDVLNPIFEESDCRPESALAYSVLYALKNEGRLNIEKQKLTCPSSGQTSPHYLLSLK